MTEAAATESKVDATTTAESDTGSAADAKAAASVAVADKTLAGGPAAADAAATAADTAKTTKTADTSDQAAAADKADWRDRMAGDNKALRNILNNYADEAAAGRYLHGLVHKITSGELKPVAPYPEKGTDEQKAEWRKANGVPEKPDAYELKLPDGVVLGEADKPGVERLKAFAHARNWSSAQLNGVMEAYYAEVDAANNARDEADGDFHQKSEDLLRADWGNDYRRNVNAVHNLLAGWPEDARLALFGGRAADGRLIGDHPAILKQLAQLALDLNPAAAVLPPSIAPSQMASRKAELEAMVNNKDSEYYQETPRGTELRAEYHKILQAEEAQAARAKPRAA